jgi:xylan 1,4-beta-xylosidase
MLDSNPKIRQFFVSRFLVLFLLCATVSVAQTSTIVVDASAQGSRFDHYWEQAFGSGRAILSLRDSYRSDLREVKKVADFKYVRFHAIFHDEVGVYDEDANGNPIFNFTYVGQIYDGLLENGVRPIVEISFMPKKLASHPEDVHAFWYKQNVSPPKDYAKWDALIRNFARFLVDRYGIDEVAKWYFEVWNEPNIDFWTGDPKQANYFELYDHTAQDLKSVSSRIRVGGPATSSAHWVPEFIAHAAREHVPLDFISTHGYPDDTVEDLFGTSQNIPVDERVCKAVEKVHNQIKASAEPNLPHLWTEWSVAGYGALKAGDTSYAATAIARTVRDCDGMVDLLSFWPFYGGFGLIAPGGIKKPKYYAFELLHKLGSTRLPNPSEDVLVTRRTDGSLAVAVWNLVPPDQEGFARTFDLEFRGVKPNSRAVISRIDAEHGDTLEAYARMGRPPYPTQPQIAEMNRKSALPPPEPMTLSGGHLIISLPANGFALVEVPW